jgi:hypothetical protein
MALTYAQTAALMADQAFRDRVKVACLHYATYIVDEASNVPAHNTRYRWAQDCLHSPDTYATEIIPTLAMDAQVQVDGGAITDTNLQTATETAINKTL